MNSDYDYTYDLHKAVAALRSGGVIAYPTDTVWGIGCDATCSEAVKKVFEIKHRADSKALITLVADEDMLAGHIADGAGRCGIEYVSASDRPVTVVYPGGRDVAPELLAADGSIGIRIVRDGFASDLCRALGGPIVSTSANISGEPAPAVYGSIEPALLDRLDYVALTGRDNAAPSRPSKVVKITDTGDIIILRD